MKVFSRITCFTHPLKRVQEGGHLFLNFCPLTANDFLRLLDCLMIGRVFLKNRNGLPGRPFLVRRRPRNAPAAAFQRWLERNSVAAPKKLLKGEGEGLKNRIYKLLLASRSSFRMVFRTFFGEEPTSFNKHLRSWKNLQDTEMESEGGISAGS